MLLRPKREKGGGPKDNKQKVEMFGGKNVPQALRGRKGVVEPQEEKRKGPKDNIEKVKKSAKKNIPEAERMW